MIPITPAQAMKAIPKLLPDLIGSKSVEMLSAYYEARYTTRHIGAMHGVCPGNVSRRIKAAREKLQRYDLWPPHWNEPHGNGNSASARLQRAAFSPN